MTLLPQRCTVVGRLFSCGARPDGWRKVLHLGAGSPECPVSAFSRAEVRLG